MGMKIARCAPSEPSDSSFTLRGFFARSRRALHDRWEARRRLNDLTSPSEREREAARAYFQARGIVTWPLLQGALGGSVEQACGAALALAWQGQAEGVRTILIRCHREEWLPRCVQSGHLGILHSLQGLGRDAVGEELARTLQQVTLAASLPDAINTLEVILSAYRLLPIFDATSPLEWWREGVRFGRGKLLKLCADPSYFVTYNLTDRIRSTALRGLLAEYPDAALDFLLEVLQTEGDHSVARTAIEGLLRLNDRRALPALQSIAFSVGHPLAVPARRAIERLMGTQADALILLRAAEPESHDEELLHPVVIPRESVDEARKLMRPA